jgi:hypothetical protein
VQIADRQLGAAQPNLQTDRQDRVVTQTSDGILGRRVEHFARLRFREG